MNQDRSARDDVNVIPAVDGVDVLTAQEDGSAGLDDLALLRRSTELDRVLVSQDQDLLCIGASLRREGNKFSGIVYAHQLTVTIGQMVADLELIAMVTFPNEWEGRIEYLPI